MQEGIFWARLPDDGILLDERYSLDDIVDLCFSELCVSECNDSFALFYGYTRADECVGRPMAAFFEDPLKARAYLYSLLTKRRVVYSIERTGPDGSRIRIIMVSHLVKRENRLIGIQGINMHQTDLESWSPLNMAGELTQKSTFDPQCHLFLEAIERCESSIVLADLTGTVVYVNSAKAMFMGCNREELVAMNVSAFRVPGQEEIEREMEFTTLKDGSWSGELLRKRFDGELIPVYMKTYLIRDSNNQPIAQLRIFLDLSEQERLLSGLQNETESLRSVVRQASRCIPLEANFRFLYERSPVGTIITDIEGCIVEANSSVCSLLQYERKRLMGRKLGDMFVDPALFARMKASLTAGMRIVDEEVQYRIVSGAVITVQQSCVLMEQTSSRELVVHFLRDITHEKQMQIETQEAQRQVSRADRLASLGQLVAGVAHELNNPLTAVLTYAHLLKRRVDGKDEMLRQLELVVEAGERCRKIVRDLLDFARERAPSKAPVEVNVLVEHVLEMIRNEILIRKIKVIPRLGANLPLFRADRHQVEQVFVNVCMNALEAMNEGGELTITSSYDAAGQALIIAIGDTGPGIPEEHRERIFDPFFTTKPPGAGTGLGLAVSSRIIGDHGGRIHLDSTIGRGSVFTFIFPAVAG